MLQDRFIRITAQMVSELAADYSKFDGSTSLRTRAVVARSAMEALFRIRAAASSPDVTIKIVYSAACDEARQCKQLLEADPAPPSSAAGILAVDEAERDSILKCYGAEKCGTGTMQIYEIAKIGGCSGYYRGHYSSLSKYVHSHYRSSAPSTSDGLRITDDSVLLALCCGAETLAEYYRCDGRDEIEGAAKTLWQGRRR